MNENTFVGDTKEGKKTRKWLTNLLAEYLVEITFTKKDGTERVMNCTLREDYLPETTGVGSPASVKAALDALTVYDVDKDDWRSFRWDSIKAVKVIVENVNA